jgi:hypothetical protein
MQQSQNAMGKDCNFKTTLAKEVAAAFLQLIHG